jgi:hypothetical protein
MKNTTTTALSLPTAVQPKPTKTEIIEAMVQRAKARQFAINEEARKERDKLRPKIEKLVIKAMKAMKPEISIYSRSEKPHCDVRFNCISSPELVALLQEYAKHDKKIEYFHEKETRQAIREGMAKKKPVIDPSRLLANPETVKAIDTTLDAMGI